MSEETDEGIMCQSCKSWMVKSDPRKPHEFICPDCGCVVY